MRTMKIIKNFEGIEKERILDMQLLPDENLQPSIQIAIAEELLVFKLQKGFQLHICNEFLRSFDLDSHIEFKSYLQYGNQINHIMKLLDIERILVGINLNYKPADIFEIMIDGFKGKNLVKKAEQEDDLKKYVLMAVDKFIELSGKVGVNKAQVFTNTSALVMDILTYEPSTRNSDNLLFHQICKTILSNQGIDISDMGFTELFLSLKEYGIPQFETVGRIRRKIQSECPKLQCNEIVGMEKSLIQDSFCNYGKEGM